MGWNDLFLRVGLLTPMVLAVRRVEWDRWPTCWPDQQERTLLWTLQVRQIRPTRPLPAVLRAAAVGGGISLDELKAAFDEINAETREAAIINAEGKRDNYFAKLAPN